MSVIKSNEIFSPQNYCDTFFGVCPVFSGNQNELRSLLDENGYSNLRDFPFEAIESIIKNKIPVVLVDTTYINNDCEMVSEHRWFEVPDENPHFEIGDVLENTIIGIEDWDGEKASIITLTAIARIMERQTDTGSSNIPSSLRRWQKRCNTV